MLSTHHRAELLLIARRALEARVRRESLALPSPAGALDARCGAFVSIHARGALRGCLGRLDPDAPLAHTVHELAALVSDSDPRFDPVRPHEIPDLEIEISVLTPEQAIASIDEVEVGRHGLIVAHRHRRGLLLPQVPSEHGWDRVTFVEHTCLKAGLPRDAWQHGAELFVFEAEVFGDVPVA